MVFQRFVRYCVKKIEKQGKFATKNGGKFDKMAANKKI